jgi:hypothetical protein
MGYRDVVVDRKLIVQPRTRRHPGAQSRAVGLLRSGIEQAIDGIEHGTKSDARSLFLH